MATLPDPQYFENTPREKIIAAFGRRMMNFSESGVNMTVPLEILNAFSRIGEEMAETGSMKNLNDADIKVIKYAKRVM